MQTRQVMLFSNERDIWVADDQLLDISVRFFAPKTTDLLGIRAYDEKGMAFFDRESRLLLDELLGIPLQPSFNARLRWSWMLTQPR